MAEHRRVVEAEPAYLSRKAGPSALSTQMDDLQPWSGDCSLAIMES